MLWDGKQLAPQHMPVLDWKGHELSRLDWEELGDTVAKDGSHGVRWAAQVGHEGWLDQAGMPPAGWGWGPAWCC